jgi:hypothetical protein
MFKIPELNGKQRYNVVSSQEKQKFGLDVFVE